MPRSDSDAVAQRPTLEQEIAKFKGFSTTNGEVSDGAPTDEEKARIAADAAQAAKDKAAADTNQQGRAKLPGEDEHTETPEEEAERIAAEAAETPEEKAARLAAETPEEKAAREAREATAARNANKRDPELRVKQAVAKQRQAERALDAANARHAADMASLTARLTALESGNRGNTSQPGQAAEPPGKPDPSKFEFGELDTRYQEAMVDWKVNVALSARDRQTHTQQLTAEQARAAQEFAERKEAISEAGREKYTDFDEVVLESAYHPTHNPSGWLLSETVGKLALKSPVGQDVLYALASNPKEAARVYRLDPMEQAAYFGRLAATFSPPAGANDQNKGGADSKPKGQVQTPKAPPPPQNRGRGANAKTTVPGDTTDFAAFERAAMGRAK